MPQSSAGPKDISTRSFRYLSARDVKSIGLGMADVLKCLHEGFRLKGLKTTEMPPKVGVHPVENAFIHAMPAYVPGHGAGLKWVSGYPSNIARGLPYINGLLTLNDPETGIVTAVMDCAWVTALRTGASVGISAMYLARRGSTSVAIIGCGLQSRMSVWALVETLTDLRQLYCYDIFPSAAEKFANEMTDRFPALKIQIVQSEVDATRHADVVVTAIPIVKHPKPTLDRDALQPGALAVSLDYDSAWTSAAMRQCDRFFCDDTPQLLYTRKLGDYFSGIPEKIEADLGDLCAGLNPGRTDDSQRIFSLNMGIAIDDIVVGTVILERARAASIGIELEL